MYINLQVKEFHTIVEGLEKERDFYFGKLRQIEILCQESEAEGATDNPKLLEILYATEVMNKMFSLCI